MFDLESRSEFNRVFRELREELKKEIGEIKTDVRNDRRKNVEKEEVDKKKEKCWEIKRISKQRFTVYTIHNLNKYVPNYFVILRNEENNVCIVSRNVTEL